MLQQQGYEGIEILVRVIFTLVMLVVVNRGIGGMNRRGGLLPIETKVQMGVACAYREDGKHHGPEQEPGGPGAEPHSAAKYARTEPEAHYSVSLEQESIVSKSKPQARRTISWWLGGEEECPHCHQLYAYEIEVRCPDCDGPSCPHCVARLERGVVCIVCSESPAESEDPAHG